MRPRVTVLRFRPPGGHVAGLKTDPLYEELLGAQGLIPRVAERTQRNVAGQVRMSASYITKAGPRHGAQAKTDPPYEDSQFWLSGNVGPPAADVDICRAQNAEADVDPLRRARNVVHGDVHHARYHHAERKRRQMWTSAGHLYRGEPSDT